MPTTLPPLLTQAPMVDAQTLRVSRVWLGWFEQSYLRQGGQEAATNTELAGGVAGNAEHIGQVESDLWTTNTTVAELEFALGALTARVTTLETTVEALQAAVTALTTRVTTLETTVSAQGARIAALETWKTAMVAALPAVLSVPPLETLADAPATADALRDNLTTAWQGDIDDNFGDLVITVNAVRNALAA